MCRTSTAGACRPTTTKQKKNPRNLALIHRYTIHLTASLRLEWDERRNPARLSARSSQYRWGISQSDEQKGRAGGWLGEGQLRYRDGHAYAWLRTRERKASCRSFAPHSAARRLPPGHRRPGLLLVLATLPAFLPVPRRRLVPLPHPGQRRIKINREQFDARLCVRAEWKHNPRSALISCFAAAAKY
jgi:hypothetical protein